MKRVILLLVASCLIGCVEKIDNGLIIESEKRVDLKTDNCRFRFHYKDILFIAPCSLHQVGDTLYLRRY